MAPSRNYLGVPWPSPANRRTGKAFYVWLNAELGEPGIYSHSALEREVRGRNPGATNPWSVGQQGDGMGFPCIHDAIRVYKRTFPTENGVKIYWA